MQESSTWTECNGHRRPRRGWLPDRTGRRHTGCLGASEGLKRLRGQTMTFDEVLDQVRALLQQRGRVTYRALQRRFALDEEYLADLKGELIKAEGVAADEGGEVLVWLGQARGPDPEQRDRGEAEQIASSDV